MPSIAAKPLSNSLSLLLLRRSASSLRTYLPSHSRPDPKRPACSAFPNHQGRCQIDRKRKAPSPAPRPCPRAAARKRQLVCALRHAPPATSPEITRLAPEASRLLCPRAPPTYQSATAYHAAPHARPARTRRHAVANLTRRPVRPPHSRRSEVRSSRSCPEAGRRAPPIHSIPRKPGSAKAERQPQGSAAAPSVLSSASTVSFSLSPHHRSSCFLFDLSRPRAAPPGSHSSRVELLRIR